MVLGVRSDVSLPPRTIPQGIKMHMSNFSSFGSTNVRPFASQIFLFLFVVSVVSDAGVDADVDACADAGLDGGSTLSSSGAWFSCKLGRLSGVLQRQQGNPQLEQCPFSSG